ncbi:DNA-binding protein HU [Vibrio phage vB_VchM_Kuja]|uniref:Viral histone-like protein n=1 Tax=Vibrio phage vB_VchM_Kuja TaxID=2686437 RepID=A0A6B9JC20_9CAUD|nr:DNA binding protein [Vibrio phage vB_VchM_Kuja]QGZ16142.1 DNA-binding protein HU [Vibrio phage vB_VchM_Kuja]
MNKADFVKKIAEASGANQTQVRAILEATRNTIVETLQSGDEVAFEDLVRFTVVDKPSREVRNPRTGEKAVKPAHKVAKAKSLGGLKKVF